jgi:hypothetical protein
MPRAILWFPEVHEQLRQGFRPGLSWPEWIVLTHRLNATILDARGARGRKPPICAHCGQVQAISVASVFNQAQRLGLVTRESARELHASWSAFRYAGGLDKHGRPLRTVSVAPPATPARAGRSTE